MKLGKTIDDNDSEDVCKAGQARYKDDGDDEDNDDDYGDDYDGDDDDYDDDDDDDDDDDADEGNVCDIVPRSS